MLAFIKLLSHYNESLEILKPDFDAHERLLDALKLDADIFVVARALEYAYALRYGDIAVTNHCAAQVVAALLRKNPRPGSGSEPLLM